MPCPIPGPEEAALLRAIKDSDPTDDALRQVYADSLLDQGREQHADLVRYQKDHDDPFVAVPDPDAATPAGRAVQAYAQKTIRDWVGWSPADVNVQFRRGLLHATMPMTRFIERSYGQGLDECRRAGWVETVELIDACDTEVRRWPYAVTRPSERIALRSSSFPLHDVAAALEKIARLESVDLVSWNGSGNQRIEIEHLAKLPGLRRLLWSICGLPRPMLEPLAGKDGLRYLCLEDVGTIKDDHLLPLYSLTGLRYLRLSGVGGLTDVALSGLASLKQLRYLEIAGAVGFGTAAIARFCNALPGCHFEIRHTWAWDEIPF